MRLPGFTAEAGTSGREGFFRRHASYANRSSAYTVTMAAQCCPPGSDATGCTAPPPPDCTTTGCKNGLFCCDCASPAVCTSKSWCINHICKL